MFVIRELFGILGGVRSGHKKAMEEVEREKHILKVERERTMNIHIQTLENGLKTFQGLVSDLRVQNLELKKDMIRETSRLQEELITEKINVKIAPHYTYVDQSADSTDYIEFVGKLLGEPLFEVLLAEVQTEFLKVISEIEPGDADSAEKRIRAAHKADGVQFLINHMAEVRAKYLALLQEKAEIERVATNAAS